MATWTDLKQYIGAQDVDDNVVQESWNTAVALVDNYVGSATVPEVIIDRAYIECGSELYHRKNAPNGVAQFQTFDAAPIRVARDPMVGVYPLLNGFVGWGIA